MAADRIWTLYFFLVVYAEEAIGIESFCIAHTVSVGDNASVSCHFTEDLSIAPQSDVNVYMYKVSHNEMEPELVLFYSWINGTSSIKLAPGYDCRSKLSNHLEIAIYNVTEEHAGIYKCIIAPSQKHQSYPCTLHVNGDSQSDFEVTNNNPTTSDTSYKDVHLSTSRPTFDENKGKHDGDIETKSETTGYIVTIICSFIAIILIVILSLILFAYRKRRICKSNRRKSINEDAEKKGQTTSLKIHQLENGRENVQETKHEDEGFPFLSIPMSDLNHSLPYKLSNEKL